MIMYLIHTLLTRLCWFSSWVFIYIHRDTHTHTHTFFITPINGGRYGDDEVLISDKAASTWEEARDREERTCGWRLEGSPGCVESETQGLVQSFVVYMHVYAWPLSALIRVRSIMVHDKLRSRSLEALLNDRGFLEMLLKNVNRRSAKPEQARRRLFVFLFLRSSASDYSLWSHTINRTWSLHCVLVRTR